MRMGRKKSVFCGCGSFSGEFCVKNAHIKEVHESKSEFMCAMAVFARAENVYCNKIFKIKKKIVEKFT